jgi:uncharacterized protein (TIGR02265 family)
VFSSNVEALLVHGLKERLDGRAREELRALGFDVDRPIPPASPARAWVDALRLAGERAFPELPHDERWFRLGGLMIERLGTTVVGAAMVALARALGPRRTLGRMTRNTRSGNNYLEAELLEQPDGTLLLVNRVVPHFRPHFVGSTVLQPQFMRGLYCGILEVLRVREYAVEVERYDAEAQEVHLRIRLAG